MTPGPRRRALVGLLTVGLIAACSGGDGEALSSTVAPVTTQVPATTQTPAASTTTLAPVTTAAPTTAAAPTTTVPRTTTTRAEPQLAELVVESEPGGVAGWVRADDGWEVAITTPWTGEVPLGTVEVTLEAEGFAREIRSFELDQPTHQRVLMDKPGQLVDTVSTFAVGGAPKQLAFTPDNTEIWVTLLNGDGVEAYDPLTGELLAAIDLNSTGTVEVIFNRAGTLAYVSQMETSSVYEIDVASKTVLQHMPAIGAWTKVMALSPDERTLYASNWVDDNIAVFDLDAGEAVRLLNTVNTPRGLYISPDGAELWVAGFHRGEIQVIDIESGRGRVIHRSGGSMRHLVGDPERRVVYASDLFWANVVAIDMDTHEVTTLATVDARPNTIDLSPDGSVLYVSSRGRDHEESYHRPGPDWGSVAVIDTATGQYLDAIVGGNQPTGLDVSPDGSLLAHSDFLDNRVTVYRLPDHATYLAGDGGRWEEHFVEIRKPRRR